MKRSLLQQRALSLEFKKLEVKAAPLPPVTTTNTRKASP
jgi:hypothetical protein